jgi:putative nucleotidyltransferase with HDIG domain
VPFDLDDGAGRSNIQIKRGLLLHSLAVACCAKDIAEMVSPQINSQLAYCAGLLHDIGKLALQEAMPKSCVRIVEEAELASECSCAIEQEHLGTDHTLIGKHLAQKWQLPNPVTLAIWLHHSETVTISQDMPEARIAAVVQLADSIARQSGIGQSGSFDFPEPSEPIAECLGISIEQLKQIRENLPAAVEEKSEILGVDSPSAVADYCGAAHAAAAQLARQHAELSVENRELQSASSHLDFAADFLLSIGSTAGAVAIAEDLATRWQKFYQTGVVCLYLAPSAGSQTLEAVVVEKLLRSRGVSLSVPAELPAIPGTIANKFAILNAYDHVDWLFEQLDADFDVARTKLVPLLSDSRAVGAIAFELHYPGDAELFEEKFRISASIAGAVLGMALAQERQQHFAERFARLISKPRDTAGSLSEHEEAPAQTTRADDSLNALAEMAAGAAHELNNPLAVISGRAQLLAEAQTDPETKEILKQVCENAREASGIIEDLMSFAEPPQPRAARTDVRNMLDEAVQLASRKMNMEDLDVRIEMAGDIENVLVDSAQVVSAIANVISNAVESYGDETGPVSITADPDESGERVKITVTDLGCGMDVVTLKKATQPFFSAKPAGRNRGMGLAYAARFVQLNGGTLNIESEPGKGTTATVCLPYK